MCVCGGNTCVSSNAKRANTCGRSHQHCFGLCLDDGSFSDEFSTSLCQVRVLCGLLSHLLSLLKLSLRHWISCLKCEHWELSEIFGPDLILRRYCYWSLACAAETSWDFFCWINVSSANSYVGWDCYYFYLKLYSEKLLCWFLRNYYPLNYLYWLLHLFNLKVVAHYCTLALIVFNFGLTLTYDCSSRCENIKGFQSLS